MMFQKLLSLLNRSAQPFQVLSDIHLEVNQQYLSFEFPVCSEHLILAGDIGRLTDYENYLQFIQKQTDRFKLVFLALGNHDFYNDTYEAGLERARRLELEPCLNGRLVLLHQRRFDVPNTNCTILGCTLWSRIPNDSKDMVLLKIQDFQKIQGWSVDSHNSYHESDLVWLMSEIDSVQRDNETQNKKQSILVVTHHAPSLEGTSSPQHTKNPWTCAFATDILSKIPRPIAVKAWVFGHTHYTTEFKNKGIRVVANQRGYVLPGLESKGSKNGFDAGKVIHA